MAPLSFFPARSFAADDPKAMMGHGKMHGPMMGGMMMHGPMDHGNLFLDYAQKLDLSEKQVADLNNLRLKSQQQEAEVRGKIHEGLEDLQKSGHDPKVDRKTVEAKADEVGRLHGDMLKLRVDTLLDARALLTDAQRKKLDDLHGHRKGRKDEDPAGGCGMDGPM